MADQRALTRYWHDSPAIGHGSNLLNLVNDQRGDTYARVVGGTIDIGAFELQTVAAPNLPGDYNGNQAVDAADFVLWRKTKGADVPQYAGADGNGSSKIDDGDYDVWRGHFGATVVSLSDSRRYSIEFNERRRAAGRTKHALHKILHCSKHLPNLPAGIQQNRIHTTTICRSESKCRGP